MSSEKKPSSVSSPVVKVCINMPTNMFEVLKKRCIDAKMDIDICIAKSVVETVEKEMRFGGR